MVKLPVVLLCIGYFLLTVAEKLDRLKKKRKQDVLNSLTFVFLLIDNGDFDLKDALDPNGKKPSEPTKKPPGGNRPRPPLYPDLRPYSDNNGNGGNSLNGGGGGNIGTGSFSDLDLNDGKHLPPYPAGEDEQNSGHGNTGKVIFITDFSPSLVDSTTTAQITSPVVAVAVLLTFGAIAGYSAYKQKRYCFKPRGKTDCSMCYNISVKSMLDAAAWIRLEDVFIMHGSCCIRTCLFSQLGKIIVSPVDQSIIFSESDTYDGGDERK
ncbi:uncharacterized protein LOC134498532 [Candoia aspera]|uniref:uncharacterized protein LOC134498532 n=1 Tax=Candoia aspera TaxID=51853 RepID=UPI002FD831D8